MDIEGLSLRASLGLILGHRRLLRRGTQLFRAVVREFFVPQFQSRLLPGLRPVAVVSHPLDDSIPFEPRLYSRYLSYFTIWLKTMGRLHQLYGNSVLDDVEEMMGDVVRLYEVAGWIYRRCQSTTTSRGRAPSNPYFLLIFLFDPHLHCIPSLHVLTVCYNYLRTRKIVMKLDHPCGRRGREAGKRLAAATYRAAQRITEAVLLVKQHSLVDIGSSLFLLSRLFPDYGEQEIERFVSGLFTNTAVLDPVSAGRIHAQILTAYDRMLCRERLSRNCPPSEVVLGYLKELPRQP